jgi:DNA ligase-1
VQSQSRKVGLINSLLAACVGVETKFLIRSLEGKLRIGLAERTVSFFPPLSFPSPCAKAHAGSLQRQVITALAQAIVTAEVEKKDGKKPSKEKLAKMLEDGTNTLKAVFSYVGRMSDPVAARA